MPGQEVCEANVEEYIRKFGLDQARVVLFVYMNVLEEADVTCLKLLVRKYQPFVLPVNPAWFERLDVNCEAYRSFEKTVFKQLPHGIRRSSDRMWTFLQTWVEELRDSSLRQLDDSLPRETTKDPKLADFVQQTEKECKKRVPVLSIVGSRGVGKSTVLNSLRGLKPTDQGAQSVGADECHDGKVTRVNHLGMEFWDVPGCDGSDVKATMGEAYINEFKLHKSDAIIFIYTSIFSNAMGDCATILHETYQKPVFFVRNKVEEDCKSQVADGNHGTPGEAFDGIKEQAFVQMRKVGLKRFAKDEHMFLISARYQETTVSPALQPWQKEWHRLMKAVSEGIQNEAKKSVVAAILLGQARELAEIRKRECESLVQTFAWQAAVGALTAYYVPWIGQAARVWAGTILIVRFMRIFALNVTRTDDPLRVSKLLVGTLLLSLGGHSRVSKLQAEVIHGTNAIGCAASAVSDAVVGGYHEHSFVKDCIPKLAQVAERIGCGAVSRAVEGDRFVKSFAKEVIPKLAKIAEKTYLVELRRGAHSDVASHNAMIREVLPERAAGA